MPLDDTEGILGHWGDIVVAIAFVAVAFGILFVAFKYGKRTSDGRTVDGSPTVPPKNPFRAISDTFQAIRLTRRSRVSIRKAQFERAIAECDGSSPSQSETRGRTQQSWARLVPPP